MCRHSANCSLFFLFHLFLGSSLRLAPVLSVAICHVLARGCASHIFLLTFSPFFLKHYEIFWRKTMILNLQMKRKTFPWEWLNKIDYLNKKTYMFNVRKLTRQDIVLTQSVVIQLNMVVMVLRDQCNIPDQLYVNKLRKNHSSFRWFLSRR